MSCYTENTTVVFTPCLAERGFLLVFINLNMQFILRVCRLRDNDVYDLLQ